MIVKCELCNNELKRKPSTVANHKMFFCNKKCKSQWQVGKEPWNKGRRDLPKHSEEHKRKIGIGVKNNENWKKTIEKNKLNLHTEKANQHRSETIRRLGLVDGKRNPMYTTGISSMKKKLKKEIIRCQMCKKDFISKWHKHVHHKNKNMNNNAPSNLMVLCAKCHMAKHIKLGDRRGRYSK